MATRKPAQKPRAKKTTKLIKYDLACGQNKQDGFIGVDQEKINGVDIVHDLVNDRPWPIASDSADELFCSHFVEHLYDLCGFMDECYRILKDGGTMTLIHPYYTSVRAWQDPTHVRGINEVTWYYFNAEWRAMQKLDHYPVVCDFEIETITAAYNEPWNLKSEEARQFAMLHYFNVISDLTVILKAKKPEPGTTAS